MTLHLKDLKVVVLIIRKLSISRKNEKSHKKSRGKVNEPDLRDVSSFVHVLLLLFLFVSPSPLLLLFLLFLLMLCYFPLSIHEYLFVRFCNDLQVVVNSVVAVFTVPSRKQMSFPWNGFPGFNPLTTVKT